MIQARSDPLYVNQQVPIVTKRSHSNHFRRFARAGKTPQKISVSQPVKAKFMDKDRALSPACRAGYAM